MERNKRLEFKLAAALARERTVSPHITSTEQIIHLKADKEALKDAVRTAITKRDELYERLIEFDKALSEEKDKVALLETRMSTMAAENQHLSEELAAQRKGAKSGRRAGKLQKENALLKSQI